MRGARRMVVRLHEACETGSIRGPEHDFSLCPCTGIWPRQLGWTPDLRCARYGCRFALVHAAPSALSALMVLSKHSSLHSLASLERRGVP